MPSRVLNSLVNCEMKMLPRSDVMVFRVPWSRHTFTTINLAKSSAVIVLVQGIK
jgi:hypothetical protein